MGTAHVERQGSDSDEEPFPGQSLKTIIRRNQGLYKSSSLPDWHWAAPTRRWPELLGDTQNETLQPEGEGTGTGPWAKKRVSCGKVMSFRGLACRGLSGR